MSKFNIRVYGLLMNDSGEILLTDEELNGFRFTKFPGGGLEQGEGTTEALKREYLEECNLGIDIVQHFYTTDFYVKSLFSEEQLMAIYYQVQSVGMMNIKLSEKPFDFDEQRGHHKQSFRWASVSGLAEGDLTFPVDKYVLKLLKKKYQH